MDRVELLTDDRIKRRTISPIVYHDVWSMYKLHESAMWHSSEVKLDKDYNDWVKLTDSERYFMSMILAFFASSDLIVVENLSLRFMREIQMVEAQVFYGFQAMIENVHSEVYSNLLDCYISDVNQRTKLLNAIDTIPCVSKKAAWAQQWITSDLPLAHRLVAFAAFEGIFFSGAFCSIYWLVERGVLPGLAKANSFIARDESLHTDFASLLYNKYIFNKLTQSELNAIITSAVDIEVEFITTSLPCRLLGMDSAQMSQYIKYVANRLVKQLGHNSIYEASQPFPFMDRIALRQKHNFFEIDPSEYQKIEPSNEDPYSDVF
jgi:ribonucleoside-diphosphate reductase beta chain